MSVVKGRRPKPQALKDLHGNPGKRKRVKSNDVHEVALATGQAPKQFDPFEPPVWLNDTGKQVWRESLPYLRTLKIYQASDHQAFTTYCLHMARLIDAEKVINKKGMTYVSKSKHGDLERVRPEVKIVEQASRIVLRFQEQFGLTPVGNTRMGAAKSQGHQLSLFGEPPAQAQGAGSGTSNDQPGDQPQTPPPAEQGDALDQYIGRHPSRGVH